MSSDETTPRSSAASEQPTEDLGMRATAVLPDPAVEERESLRSEASSQRDGQVRPADARASVPAPYGTPSVPPHTVAAAPSTPFSLTSLILGVTSVFFGLTVIAPVAGLVFGLLGLRREPTGRTLAIWGIVLNAVMIGLVGLFVAFLVFAGLLLPLVAVATGDYR
ncbi:DUF4190 domain-containing protein [Rathayibacter sp. VKM Ac-2630]|jgi:hypothetical protein|uniref:DUF4190 domain-containing protein n=1 Tax=Rathayibacter sp. VKM Ac-2630 TaxID=1938617 RepID=UPI0009824FAD|nr:DUF4190 domain-containing protein [Rathayibacter sp. VKM Ac-2630]OOB91249.1 hypothetical protein B0T42_06915 [Rathayibacter sp. VKM Ac-2630]